MGTYCYDESTKDTKCDFCGQRFEDVAQMYSCDSCSKKMCDECKPELADIDCPNEFCECCIEEEENERAKTQHDIRMTDDKYYRDDWNERQRNKFILENGINEP